VREHQSEIKARGANLAAIGMGYFTMRAHSGKRLTSHFSSIDVDRAAYRAVELKSANLLHLLRRDNAVARKRANAAGHRQINSAKIPSSSALASFSVPAMWTASATSAKHSATMPALRTCYPRSRVEAPRIISTPVSSNLEGLAIALG
jgi:hypothetical protein